MSEENIIKDKIYQLWGLNTAMYLLRPGAKFEISNKKFSSWEDERPMPTWEEIEDTMKKLKDLEDSINTIWTKEQFIKHQNKFSIHY